MWTWLPWNIQKEKWIKQSYPVVLWQVRKNWFRGNQSISLSQDSHHHLTARHFGKAKLSGSKWLFLCHTPAQLNLLHVETVCRSATPQLWEYSLDQGVPLSVHVSERGGNKHTYTSPPEDKGGKWLQKGLRKEGKLHKNNGSFYYLLFHYLNCGVTGICTTVFVVSATLEPSGGGMLYSLSTFSTWSSSRDDPRSATNLMKY